MKNIITFSRIIFAIAIFFVTPLSLEFYIFYILGAVSDILDGYIARKYGNITENGAKFDTIADIIFAVVCLYKVLPVLSLSLMIWIWVLIIFLIKIASICYGFYFKNEFVTVHNNLNKITGILVYLIPFFVKINFYIEFVCLIATVAAIYELKIVKNK